MRFNILYIDPAWQYRVCSKKGKGRTAEHYYSTMRKEDIFSLDISGIAAENCTLFLWVTFPCLIEGLEAIRRWGFTYKTATKGKLKRISKAVHSIIDAPVENHSKKPDIVRNKIVELMGDLPRAELFARKRSDGWVCLGNEIDGLDIREAIKRIKEE